MSSGDLGSQCERNPAWQKRRSIHSLTDVHLLSEKKKETEGEGLWGQAAAKTCPNKVVLMFPNTSLAQRDTGSSGSPPDWTGIYQAIKTLKVAFLTNLLY